MAGRRSGPDLVSLAALAVLAHAPRHTYDLHRFLVDTHKDFVTGLPRSLYHAVDRLTESGFVEPAATNRRGRRPERTVHRITDAGRVELDRRLRDLLVTLDRDPTGFTAALSLLGGLSPEAAATALRDRTTRQREHLSTLDATLTELATAAVPRLALLKLEYERARHATELDWTERVAGELTDGRIAWETTTPVAD